MDVIMRIKTLTAQKEWAQYRLAKEAALSPSTIANIFSRGTVPSIATLELICNAFQMSLCKFFMEDETGDAIPLSTTHNRLIRCWDALTPHQQHRRGGLPPRLPNFLAVTYPLYLYICFSSTHTSTQKGNSSLYSRFSLYSCPCSTSPTP